MEITLNIDIKENKDIEESILSLIKKELGTMNSKKIGELIQKEIEGLITQTLEYIFEDSDNLYKGLNETITEHVIETVKKKLGV